jgi:hypothetical protein
VALDEVVLRRPGIDLGNSVGVVFGDQGTWHVPKLLVRMRPIFKGRKTESVLAVTDDPEFNALVKTIEEEDSYASLANMAAWLLCKNYELSDEQLGDILIYDPKDESPDRWALKVMAVIYGRTGPKA